MKELLRDIQKDLEALLAKVNEALDQEVPEEPPTVPQRVNPLEVPYEYQNDNASGTGYRECFSSSCAMIARYWGKVTSDDQYNKLRAKYGDTTDPQSHVAALKAVGLHPAYLQNGSAKDLEREIDGGRPVAVGWLHKGSVSHPTGGGHWSVVIGYTSSHFILHDPNGEANLVHGGYNNHVNGREVHYSRKNWLPRWEVEGPGTGWYMTCKP